MHRAYTAINNATIAAELFAPCLQCTMMRPLRCQNSANRLTASTAPRAQAGSGKGGKGGNSSMPCADMLTISYFRGPSVSAEHILPRMLLRLKASRSSAAVAPARAAKHCLLSALSRLRATNDVRPYSDCGVYDRRCDYSSAAPTAAETNSAHACCILLEAPPRNNAKPGAGAHTSEAAGRNPSFGGHHLGL